jgi:hypothetical protein
MNATVRILTSEQFAAWQAAHRKESTP